MQPPVLLTVLLYLYLQVLIVSGKTIKYLYTYNKLKRTRVAAIKDLQALKQAWRHRALEQVGAK